MTAAVDTMSVASQSSWKAWGDKFRSVAAANTNAGHERRGRERDTLVSLGRGGSGNMVREADAQAGRSPSASRGRPRPSDGPDDFSLTEGREVDGGRHGIVTHSGRGGAGNIRSPSRDVQTERASLDADHERVIKAIREDDRAGRAVSTGRGGSGNIARSKSRDVQAQFGGAAAAATTVPATGGSSAGFGRGGFGNHAANHPNGPHAAGYDLEAERAAALGVRSNSASRS
ncbi:hypothetical protein BKA62DRAFT_712961 [Auriculariales sp. MPI-PUGE-AT-0066]|nr:hypothetical protein BKA62DRAFT_712961 [Auriculariales sp. MPI-PUGE-AT-0066]